MKKTIVFKVTNKIRFAEYDVNEPVKKPDILHFEHNKIYSFFTKVFRKLTDKLV